MKKIWNFLVKSSVDPKKTSLTIKLALVGVIPYFMQAVGLVCAFGYSCITIDPSLLEQVASLIADGVFLILSLIAVIGALYGALRKVYLTIKGENKAIV